MVPPSEPAPPIVLPAWSRPGSGAPAAAGLRPDVPVALLRERLALQAAEVCARRLGGPSVRSASAARSTCSARGDAPGRGCAERMAGLL
jgi:hypothetical protein